MAVVMAAKICEARIVFGMNVNQQRLNTAKRQGATYTINGSWSVTVAIRAASIGTGVCYAIDTTGLPAIIRTMIDSLGIKGEL